RGHGVKGKYSIVPYPACVGWVDREMPGWSRADLLQSVKVAQSLADSWDFHPEMVTHTRIIDLKTGRPYPEASERFMENWGWTDGKSADEIGAYMAYALGMLKNAGFPCEGITTPGGFGNRALGSLSLGNLQACRDIFRAEIPHYFRHLFIDDRSVAPRVEYARGIAGPDPECSVSIIGCTGDWFGGWDGLERPALERLITADGKGGRLPQVIARGEPAIIVCHWPGLYCNGDEIGFTIFQKVVERLKDHYPDLVWMKLSEVARYWAARELTRIDRNPAGLRLHAPFSAPNFTLAFSGAPAKISGGGKEMTPQEVAAANKLRAGTFWRSGARSTLCFDLPKGATTIEFAG
ncbi:MAG TPA: hypothetical protein VNC50_07630, partial [Planctomycetia bacterium]|nr:hypothetical protein [Planctomycetia bacterium]